MNTFYNGLYKHTIDEEKEKGNFNQQLLLSTVLANYSLIFPG